MYFTGSILADVIIVTLSMISVAYWYLTKNHDYWKKRNVPFTKPQVFFGHFKDLFFRNISVHDFMSHLYSVFEGERYCGYFVFQSPVLFVRDVDLIHRILVTDFSHFHDRHVIDNLSDRLSESLNSARGSKWRTMRQKLTPAFTTSKTKGMFQQIMNCCDVIVQNIADLSRDEGDFDVLPLTYKYTFEIVASCAFGLDSSLYTPQRSQFSKMANNMFNVSLKQYVIFSLGLLFPKITHLLRLHVLPKSADDFFIGITRASIEYRKQNNVQRNDFLQLFMTLKEQEESGKCKSNAEPATEEDEVVNQLRHAPVGSGEMEKVFTEDSIASSLFSFFSVGADFPATSIAFTLLELAREPDVQFRVQEEVDTVIAKHGGWSYEAVKEMVYLDQVIQETQRLHTVGSPLVRRVTRRYQVPGSELVLDPGVDVVIPVAAIHRDPQYYPSPQLFDPERFRDNNYKPGPTYFPFGDGPRICIVMQFAILELKVCLARIVSRYSFTLSHRTRLPLRYDPECRFTKPVGGFWLNFQPRANCLIK